ncbi:MAG: CDP-alcohol phosphatidyltransferase family protein, partial [Desulfurivibrionaceae bacterium]
MNLLTGIKHLIPNLLSIFRLTLAVLFPFSQASLWVWMIIGAGASDFLDGLLARWLKVTSISGGLLDGIADKAFMF